MFTAGLRLMLLLAATGQIPAPAELTPLPPGVPNYRAAQPDWGKQQAQLHACRGTELATKGAYFAARRELTSALRFQAEGCDAQSGSRDHARALDAALLALAEVGEFIVQETSSDLPSRLARIAGKHRTPVLKQLDAGIALTLPEACGRYCAFAQQQLLAAVGGEPGSAEIFRGLARIHEILAAEKPASVPGADWVAVTYYRAAFAVNPHSPQVANDLGIALAHLGAAGEALGLLEYSLTLQPNPVVANNLAALRQRLGPSDIPLPVPPTLPRMAGEREVAETIGRMVSWVDLLTFSQMVEQPSARFDTWAGYEQGEYVGRARSAHVMQYRLRVDDHLDIVYRPDRSASDQPYRLHVGDEIRVQSLAKPAEINLDRVLVQPDGMVTLRLLGQVPAAGKNFAELCANVEQAYERYFPTPAVSVTPIKINTPVQDLIEAVDRRYGAGGGQARLALVMPDGAIALPEIGNVQAQGLTLPELQAEVNEQYREKLPGIEVNPILVQRAPRYVFVLGEVGRPGRFELTGPTTLTQAVSLAGGWNVGANLRHVIVLRRGDDWQLMGCIIDINDALYRAKKPCPRQDIWLSDSDVVIVPKGDLLKASDFVDLVFTRGIYRVFPLNTTINFTKLNTL